MENWNLFITLAHFYRKTFGRGVEKMCYCLPTDGYFLRIIKSFLLSSLLHPRNPNSLPPCWVGKGRRQFLLSSTTTGRCAADRDAQWESKPGKNVIVSQKTLRFSFWIKTQLLTCGMLSSHPGKHSSTHTARWGAGRRTVPGAGTPRLPPASHPLPLHNQEHKNKWNTVPVFQNEERKF